MVKRVFGVITCFVILAMACVAMAGGAVAPAPVAPCAPAPCGPQMGNPCAYWGDARFPGLCGGVVPCRSWLWAASSVDRQWALDRPLSQCQPHMAHDLIMAPTPLWRLVVPLLLPLPAVLPDTRLPVC